MTNQTHIIVNTRTMLGQQFLTCACGHTETGGASDTIGEQNMAYHITTATGRNVMYYAGQSAEQMPACDLESLLADYIQDGAVVTHDIATGEYRADFGGSETRDYSPVDAAVRNDNLDVAGMVEIDTVKNAGAHNCACCGDMIYTFAVLCDECQSAQCTPKTNSAGIKTYGDCQRDDYDDDDQDDDETVITFNDPDGYDRNGAFDGFQVTTDAEGNI